MEFRTPIDIQPGLTISHSDKVLMLGSCFTDYVGQKFTESKLNALVNPFGALFNPESIAMAIERAIDNIQVTDNDIFQYRGLWSSFGFHGSFSSTSKDDALQKMNASICKAHDWIKGTSLLFLTFGTAYVYRDTGDGKVVANCHKLPGDRFVREMLSAEAIAERFHDLAKRLLGINPDMKIVLTVSPVRHLRDGAHQNQISKSTLLLAIDKLAGCLDCVHYFPSYEIMMDDLRDYRFYDADMVHPSPLAVEYIWQRICDTCFSKDELSLIDEISRIESAVRHRPLNPDTDEFRQFAEKQKSAVEKLASLHPEIDLTSELDHWKSLLL